MTTTRRTRTLQGMKAFIEAEPFRLADYWPAADGPMFTGDDSVKAEQALLRALDGLPQGSLLLVDPGKVRIASDAARQLLRRPLLRLATGELADRYLVLGELGPSDYNVQVMLRGEKLTVVERSEKGVPKLIGQVDPAMEQTYEFLRCRDSATASEVQLAFDLGTISAATNRLSNLARLALARRIGERTVPGGGREYVYAAVQ